MTLTVNGRHPISGPTVTTNGRVAAAPVARQAGTAGTPSGQKIVPKQLPDMPVTTRDPSGTNGAANLIYGKMKGLRGGL